MTRRGIVFVFFVSLVLSGLASCSSSGPEDLFKDLVYSEDFSGLAANGWTNTEDTTQFPVPPSGYSFTLDAGRYKVTSSLQTADTPVCAGVKDGGAMLSVAMPYKLSCSLSLPAQSFIADALIRFNFYKDASIETYDYLFITSHGEYYIAHFDTIGGYSFYTTNAWQVSPAINIDGSANDIVITQGATSFTVDANGVRLGYCVNTIVPDGDVGFFIGLQRDSRDLASVGNVEAYFDDIAVYR